MTLTGLIISGRREKLNDRQHSGDFKEMPDESRQLHDKQPNFPLCQSGIKKLLTPGHEKAPLKKSSGATVRTLNLEANDEHNETPPICGIPGNDNRGENPRRATLTVNLRLPSQQCV